MPFRFGIKSLMANDLDDPGIPTIINGSLFIMQTNETNIFYFKASLIAIADGTLIF